MKITTVFLTAMAHLVSQGTDLPFEPSLAATMANDPSSIVDGKVSAISGDPCLGSVDLVVQGVEPILITRHYVPGKQGAWNLAWDFARAYEVPDAPYRWVVHERGEAPIIYKKEGTVKTDNGVFVRYTASKLNKGFSNTSNGKISSRTNSLNHVILVDDKSKYFMVHRADGTVREYKKVYQSDNEYKLISEHLPNGNWVFYEYGEIPQSKKDFKTILSRIYTTNPSKDKIYASVEFQYSDPLKSKTFSIKGSDGQTLNFNSYGIDFQSSKSHPYREGISSSAVIDQTFEYLNYKNSGNQQRLYRILFPLNREIKFEYYSKDEESVAGKKIEMGGSADKRRNRIKALASAGRTTYSFIYQLNRDFRNATSVYDCDHNLTEYLFGNDLRLWELKRYSHDKSLLNREECNWGDEKLQWRAFYDGKGEIVHSKRYIYDSLGNVLEEKFFGNLSGHGPPVVLNHLGEPISGAERFVKRFRYSPGRPSLLLEEHDDSGMRIVYDYLSGTDLLVSRLTYDKEKLICRKFYEYNHDHILIRETEDDGERTNSADLTGVGVRTIRKILPLASGPYVGMPHIIEDLYWEKGQEHLLKKVMLTYTTGARIAQQDIFDSNGLFKYSLKISYDEKGRVIEQTNAVGQVERFSYDECGNRIFSQGMSGRTTVNIGYDNFNRPVEQLVVRDDGPTLTSHFAYDGRNNLVTETDSRGNATHHGYDSLNRRIQTILPPVHDEHGILAPSTTRRVLDTAGNEIQQVDACGNVTNISYNAYGKPIAIMHPDGAKEEYIYNLDGSLKTSVDPLGVASSFDYDGLGRILRRIISSRGRMISEEQFEYCGLRLTAKTDGEGNRTIYAYDGAGRKIMEEYGGETTSYEYDSLGRVHKIWNGEICQVTEYDLLDRIIEERKESSTSIFWKVRYEYDSEGNRSAIIRSIAGQEEREVSHYDSLNRLVQKIDALDASEFFSYEDTQALRKTHTDTMGLETIEIYDAQNRLSCIEKRKGQPVAIEEKSYTPNGLLSYQVNTVFSPDGNTRKIHTRWKYDSRGRVATLTEADGTLQAKTTLYSYTPRGELAQTTKPDRTTLNYLYDELGCLISLTSSDGTVHHTMGYDRLKRLRLLDGVERNLDFKGRLLSENGVENKYDPMGRRVECRIAAANCMIEYGYEGENLKTVTRKTADGTPLFTHAYLDHDLSGRPLQETLIGGKGAIQRSVNPLGRTWRLEAPGFSQEIEDFDSVGNIRRMRIQNDELVYGYDALYQLTSETGHEYLYDSLYNRLEKDGEKYKVDALNQIPSHFEYDQNGNPIRHGDRIYTYDALNRLIRVERPEWRQIYTYDGLHRCLTQTTLRGREQTVRRFLYDGMNEIGSFDEAHKLLELRILGSTPHAEIGAAVAIELNGKIYAPIHDLQGNIAILLPIDRETPASYRFSAFGEEEIQGSVYSPWRFSSKRVDEQNGLINFGRRFYSPELGRWLTPDPEGFTDGMNLYAYVHNDPLTNFDEYGLVTYVHELGWQNCPWNSPFSYSNPKLMPSFAPESWNLSRVDSRLILSLNLYYKRSPHYYVNGILNSASDCRRGAEALQKSLGSQANVIPIYSKSLGFFDDMKTVFRRNNSDYSNLASWRLNRALRASSLYMDALNDPRKLFVTAFSRGGADIYHAIKTLNSDQKNRLIVTVCGPIMIIPRDFGFSVTNLVSQGDWCSYACNRGLKKNPRQFENVANVEILPQLDGFSGFTKDHFFLSQTYQRGIKKFTSPAYDEYGGTR